MNQPSREKKLYRKYTDKVSSLLQDEEAQVIFDSLANGKNTYMRLDQVESSAFDLTWIDMIESCIPDLSFIISNPKMNTKTVEDLVPVELAKKTNAESVQHLASHTQYIKEVDENLNVIPSKILNIGSDDELKIYENRFVATLIKMLLLFISKRYDYASKFATLHDHETLYFKNRSTVGNAEVSIETKINVITKKDDPESIQSNRYVDRIAEIRRYVLYFYNSSFMKLFKNEKNVRNPILQTNIIRKNVRYHHCYELYRFIEAYDRLGINYSVKETFSQFDKAELRELNFLMFANYLSLQGKDKSLTRVEKENRYEPEIITSNDDEEFIYGPLLQGPIAFVRVDDAYRKYLEHRTHQNLPQQPTKAELAYFADEYQEGREKRREYLENLRIFKHKADQKIVFDKKVQEIIAEREREEKEEEERYIQKRLALEARYLDIFRQNISVDAQNFFASVNNNGIIYPDYQGYGEYSQNLAQQVLPYSDEDLLLLMEHKTKEEEIPGQVSFSMEDKPSQVFALQKELAEKNQEIALLQEQIKQMKKRLGLIEENPIDKCIRLNDLLTEDLDEEKEEAAPEQKTPITNEETKQTGTEAVVSSREKSNLPAVENTDALDLRFRLHDLLTDGLSEEMKVEERVVVSQESSPATVGFDGFKILTRKLDLHAGYDKQRTFRLLTKKIDLDKESQYHQRHLYRTLTDFADEVDYKPCTNIDKVGEKGFIVRTSRGYLAFDERYANTLSGALIYATREQAKEASLTYQGEIIEL